MATMTILELLQNIFFNKKYIKKNFVIFLLFNFFSFFFTYLNFQINISDQNNKFIIFKDVPINISNTIYLSQNIRALISDDINIIISKDGLGFEIWNYKFTTKSKSPLNPELKQALNQLFLNTLLEEKKYMESITNKNPTEKIRLKNIDNYLIKNKTNKDLFVYENISIKEIILKNLISNSIQANILYIIFIFFIRIRFFKKKL